MLLASSITVLVVGRRDVLLALGTDDGGFVDGLVGAGDALRRVEVGLEGLDGLLVAEKEIRLLRFGGGKGRWGFGTGFIGIWRQRQASGGLYCFDRRSSSGGGGSSHLKC